MNTETRTNTTPAYYEANVGNEHSKSAGAAEAESEGRYPLTVAAKKLGLTARAFRAGCASAKYNCAEWHHTGSYARRTDYYDVAVLAANADFWRGAARKYGAKKAAEILAAHNVNPLSDTELDNAKTAAIKNAVENVERFLGAYTDKYVVQLDFLDGKGWRQKLRGNSAMTDLGLLSGYDYRERGLPVLTREEAESEVARHAANPSKNFPNLKTRIVSVREDLLTKCPLYGRVAGEFLRLGEACDFVTAAG